MICQNLDVVSILVLLRIHARETRAWYKIIWEIQQDIQHQDLKFESQEGDGESSCFYRQAPRAYSDHEYSNQMLSEGTNAP